MRTASITTTLLSLLAIGATGLTGCNTLASGRKYTLAKVDRDSRLIEPHRLLEPSSKDCLDQVNPTGNWGIKLNGGFLPYLEAVENPEVVVFVSVRIREQNEAEESLLWERVYLNSEVDEDHVALDKDSFFPYEDKTLLPPIVYEGQDIFVQIRVIELDQEDNARTRQLINTAASAAVAFKPDAGLTLSVFQTALNFLSESNADDIEFQYDFALSETPGAIDYNGKRYDNVLNPRIGKYVLVKTEHRNRTNLPQGYLATGHHGLRYAAAELLKWGTLGVVNWSTAWAGSDTDWYHWLFHYPLTVPEEAWRAPEWTSGGRRLKCSDGEELQLVGDRLVGGHGDKKEHPYEEQAYLVLSLYEAKLGVDVKSLAELAKEKKLVEELDLVTGKLSVGASEEYLKLLTEALTNSAQKRTIRADFLERLAAAGSSGAKKVANEFLGKATQSIQGDSSQSQELESFIKNRAARCAGVSDDRIQIRRNTTADQPQVKIGFRLDAEDIPDGSGIRLEFVPIGGGDASSLKEVETSLSESAFGSFKEGTVESKDPQAFQLILTRRTKTGVETQTREFWITKNPEVEDLQLEAAEGLGTFRVAKWEPKKKAFLEGLHLDFVDRVRIEFGSEKAREFPVKRDGKKAWIENSTDESIVIQKATLIMVDPEFFADLEGEAGMTLSKAKVAEPKKPKPKPTNTNRPKPPEADL